MPPTEPRSVTVPAGVLDAIRSHARAEAPRECCGLLVGSAEAVVEAVPFENGSPDPHRLYEIAPWDYLGVVRRLRGTPHSVVGSYHSHPRSAPEPSPTDLAQAFPDFLYVIAGPVADSLPLEIRAYRLEEGNFRPVLLVTEG